METRRALIIGCSDGIGLASARRLVGHGWTVTGVSRSPSPLAHAHYAHVVSDVAADDFPTTLATVLAGRGPFDVCIYCAGIGCQFDVNHIEEDERAFAVNVGGALRTARIVLPRMVEAGRGHMVVLSSQADELVISENPSYGASKAAMSSYFEGVGLALRRKGVAITNLRFGFVDTKMARAPVKPFCMTVERAARIIERCLESKPLRCTRPLRMAMVVSVLRFVQRWRIRLA